MDTTLTLDFSRLNWKMVRLAEFLGNEAGPLVVLQEAKGFVEGMEVAPPKKSGAQKRIERSIYNAVTLLSGQRVWSLLGGNALRKRLRQLGISATDSPLDARQIQAVLAIFQNIPRYAAWTPVAGGEIPSHVKSLTNKWGRVDSRKPFYTTDFFAFQGYLAQELLNAGIVKSGWAASAYALGVELDGYIAKHGTRWGTYAPDLQNPNGASVTMTNNGVKLPDYEATVGSVIAGREKAMGTKLAALMQGKAINLGFATVEGESWGGNAAELSW